MEAAAIGVDLGGTAVKMGLVDHAGNILDILELRTPVAEGYAGVIHFLTAMTDRLLQANRLGWHDVQGVGVGVPGYVELPEGTVVEAVNLGWRNVPLKQDLERIWRVPVTVDNDANAAALGEMWTGAGQGASNLLCLTLGTGIGGGVIINGEVYHGTSGIAGEIGHMTVRREGGRQCNCGRKGCLETEASATAIVKDVQEQLKLNGTGPLQEEYDRSGTITAKAVVQLAEQGDPVCQGIIRKVGRTLGTALANVCCVLNPEIIVIGGGVSRAGNLLLNPVREAFNTAALPRIAQKTSIAPAKLGNQAGLIGAAWLVQHSSKNQ